MHAAERLLLANRRQGRSRGLRRAYFYTCPSPKSYPFQWFWDSCFHAIALSRLDPDAAKREIWSLLSVQRPDGFLPHVIFWRGRRPSWARLESNALVSPHFTAEVQPPVLALAVWAIVRQDGDRDFLAAVFPQLVAYHRYLKRARDPEGSGLLTIFQSRESGLDFSPQYDELWGQRNGQPDFAAGSDAIFHAYQRLGWDPRRMRKAGLFVVKDVLFNAIYGEALRVMGDLARLLGRKTQASIFRHEAALLTKALVRHCWDTRDHIFYSLRVRGRERRLLRRKTIASLMPLVLRDLPKAKARALVERHLLDEREFWTPFPVPSVSADDPAFDPRPSRWIWRGPTWVNTNWFLVRGLLVHGEAEAAEAIRKRTCRLVHRHGFHEYYHPYTGEGGGAKDFSWSTLAVDLLDQGSAW